VQAYIEQPIKSSIHLEGFRQSSSIKGIRRQPALLLGYVILIAYTFVSLCPILWMFFLSFEDRGRGSYEFTRAAREWFWEHYSNVLTTTRVPGHILKSAWISALTVSGILAFGSLAGFAFSHLKSKGLQQGH
jgi:ABC-type glycerol-3-phosphate transport system permease component